MVRCNTCELVRSDPVASPDQVATLYHESTFDYSLEVGNLVRTYGAYLARLDCYSVSKGSILEIGCGNGFFLKQARTQGYADVRGVEPSLAAIQLAAPDIRDGIQCSMMRPGLFSDSSFDVICLFQVLDHIFDPADLLETCLRILKPGGFVLCLNHNVNALSARLMKERSPIIDIEHTYLYSPATMKRLFGRIGYEVKEVGRVQNRYSLRYLARLLPLPPGWKEPVMTVLDRTGLGRLPLRVPLGNLYLIARKPLG